MSHWKWYFQWLPLKKNHISSDFLLVTPANNGRIFGTIVIPNFYFDFDAGNWVEVLEHSWKIVLWQRVRMLLRSLSFQILSLVIKKYYRSIQQANHQKVWFSKGRYTARRSVDSLVREDHTGVGWDNSLWVRNVSCWGALLTFAFWFKLGLRLSWDLTDSNYA